MSDDNLYTFVEVSSLRVGSYIVHNERPCKISEINVSKTGKHGAAKAVMTMKDIFTGSKHCTTYSTGDKVQAPIIQTREYILIDFTDDDDLTVLNNKGEEEVYKVGKHEILKEVENNIRNDFQQGKQIELKMIFSMNDYGITTFISKSE